jgi:hypothetical protein
MCRHSSTAVSLTIWRTSMSSRVDRLERAIHGWLGR